MIHLSDTFPEDGSFLLVVVLYYRIV